MITRQTLLTTFAAIATLTATADAQQRKAETRLVGGVVEARIVDPAGVDVYTVFQGVGIGGPVEKPATLGNCASPIYITLGPLTTHNHQHTIDWTDCNNTRHRWAIAVPVSSQWLSGSTLPVGGAYGFGCGMFESAALDIDADPALGTVRSLDVSGLPAGTVGAFTFLSTAPAPGWGFPLSAVGIDAAECYVFLDLATAAPLGGASVTAGAASFSLGIPANPALTGMAFYAQSLALSPGVNPAGVVTTNGLSLVLAP